MINQNFLKNTREKFMIETQLFENILRGGFFYITLKLIFQNHHFFSYFGQLNCQSIKLIV